MSTVQAANPHGSVMGFPSFSTTKKRRKDGKGLEALPSASKRLVVMVDGCQLRLVVYPHYVKGFSTIQTVVGIGITTIVLSVQSLNWLTVVLGNEAFVFGITWGFSHTRLHPHSLPLTTCSWLPLLPPHHSLNYAYLILRYDLTQPTYTYDSYDPLIYFPGSKSKSHMVKKKQEIFIPP